MKTKTTMLALLLMAATAMQSVGQGTIIDSVEWADANVSTPGNFAVRPDMHTQYTTGGIAIYHGWLQA